MAGEIVELEEKLFIVADFKNNEDYSSTSYSRIYFLYPYNSELPDTLEISIKACFEYKVDGLTNPVNTRDDKMSYTKYGESNIRGEKTVYLERKWDELKPLPTK